jgi:hypothetical protein
MVVMFRALLVCSEGECAEAFEAYGSLEELETLACDCGCSLELLEISEVDEPAERGFTLAPVR